MKSAAALSPEKAMAQALRLAEMGRATTHPNPRVGCVIVQKGKVVGEGFHARAGEMHAEIQALRAAGDKSHGAEIFVTLEPCCHQGRTGPCVTSVIAAKPHKVWVAMQDPNPLVAGKGIAQLRKAGIEVEVGLMEDEAEDLNRGFVSRMTRGRPFVTLKLAASLDGRTATSTGESKWITSEEARADVHRLRAEAGAVLTSSATVMADNPELTVRIANAKRQPDRIVLDTHLRSGLDAKVWAPGARRILLAVRPRGDQVDELKRRGVEVQLVGVSGGGHVDLPSALASLGRLEVNEVFVECGPRLAGAMLQAGIVDQLVVYIAPSLLGHDGRSLAELPGLRSLHQRIPLEFTDVKRIGPDLRVIARPLSPLPLADSNFPPLRAGEG
jgi:diaminohydroxyphosphoribosylaminopyrimidine deaminase/5-amino-6-(5-phosphoribosylamino)uracil reductase